MLKSDIQLTT